jgi:CO/xanthine dehydrogenase FAD-binding subunit
MKPAPFEYFAPTSVEETCNLLARYGDDAKILAGGQSLVPLLALHLAQPAVLIDINPVRELDYVQANGAGLSIGAGTRHRTVERSPAVREQFPLLSAGIEWIGHPQIRNWLARMPMMEVRVDGHRRLIAAGWRLIRAAAR